MDFPQNTCNFFKIIKYQATYQITGRNNIQGSNSDRIGMKERSTLLWNNYLHVV